MDKDQARLVGLFLVLPLVVLLLALWYVQSHFATRKHQTTYKLSFLGRSLTLPWKTSVQLLLVLVGFLWFDTILSLPLSSLFLLLLGGGLIRIGRGDALRINDDTAQLIARLASTQSAVQEARQHIERLSQNVVATQAKLDAKERLKQSLESLIQQRSEEAKAWAEMSQPQRDAFVDAAAAAMSKGSRGAFWWGAVLGFVLNLLATLTWALLGNPGKDELIKKLRELVPGTL